MMLERTSFAEPAPGLPVSPSLPLPALERDSNETVVTWKRNMLRISSELTTTM